MVIYLCMTLSVKQHKAGFMCDQKFDVSWETFFLTTELIEYEGIKKTEHSIHSRNVVLFAKRCNNSSCQSFLPFDFSLKTLGERILTYSLSVSDVVSLIFISCVSTTLCSIMLLHLNCPNYLHVCLTSSVFTHILISSFLQETHNVKSWESSLKSCVFSFLGITWDMSKNKDKRLSKKSNTKLAITADKRAFLSTEQIVRLPWLSINTSRGEVLFCWKDHRRRRAKMLVSEEGLTGLTRFALLLSIVKTGEKTGLKVLRPRNWVSKVNELSLET